MGDIEQRLWTQRIQKIGPELAHPSGISGERFLQDFHRTQINRFDKRFGEFQRTCPPGCREQPSRVSRFHACGNDFLDQRFLDGPQAIVFGE